MKKILPQSAGCDGEVSEFMHPLLLRFVSQIKEENNKRAQKIHVCEYTANFSSSVGIHQEVQKKTTLHWEKKIDSKYLGFNG